MDVFTAMRLSVLEWCLYSLYEYFQLQKNRTLSNIPFTGQHVSIFIQEIFAKRIGAFIVLHKGRGQMDRVAFCETGPDVLM